MRRSIAILLSVLMVLGCLALTACGKKEEAPESAAATATAAQETATAQPTATETQTLTPAPTSSAPVNNYGYDGNEAWEAAIYRYLATDFPSKNYETGEGIYSVPVVRIIDVAETDDGGCDVWGDFDIYNYKLEGETLSTVSGGNYPGKIHVSKNGDSCTVTDFTVVEDGANYDSSAKEIFGDRYEEFASVNSDEDSRNAARKDILAIYVKANGLNATQYQDYGWDPVKIF